jgi:Bacteriophage protein of unknown function (DUF646).
MVNIPVDRLADEITNVFHEYSQDVSDAIEKEVDKVAKDILRELKTNHPYQDRTGEYTKGFGITKENGYGIARRVIWNKKHYQRVHLLEFGHAKVNGGRVPAYPHMRPAYEKHVSKLPDKIKRVIETGG